MTTAYVFVGPTLARGDLDAAAPAAGEITVLPPAAQGDVYRLTQARRPRAIAVVDGYFEGVPAVWHKEILFAMAEGVHVLGGGSMGALRAAELAAFGMRGVGRIFEAYRDGELEDDDEVAVLHGPAETGFVAVSEAMVNVRATLERAEAEGLIGPPTRRALVGLGKGLFYQERSWPAVFEAAAARGLLAGELEALRAWLPRGRVDLKRDDALAVLAALRALLASDPGPNHVAYSFEWTGMWDDATAAAAAAWAGRDGAGAERVGDERLLDELRLDGDTFRDARRRALLRLLALREADRRRLMADRGAVGDALHRFRAERGLFTRADLDRWLADNGLDAEGFERLMEEEARLAAVERRAGLAALRPHLLAALRMSGDHARLAERARRKQRALAALGLDDPEPAADAGLAPAALVVWWFERRLGRPVPEDLDARARELGFADRDEFYRALARERLYWEATTKRGAEAPPPP